MIEINQMQAYMCPNPQALIVHCILSSCIFSIHLMLPILREQCRLQVDVTNQGDIIGGEGGKIGFTD